MEMRKLRIGTALCMVALAMTIGMPAASAAVTTSPAGPVTTRPAATTAPTATTNAPAESPSAEPTDSPAATDPGEDSGDEDDGGVSTAAVIGLIAVLLIAAGALAIRRNKV